MNKKGYFTCGPLQLFKLFTTITISAAGVLPSVNFQNLRPFSKNPGYGLETIIYQFPVEILENPEARLESDYYDGNRRTPSVQTLDMFLAGESLSNRATQRKYRTKPLEKPVSTEELELSSVDLLRVLGLTNPIRRKRSPQEESDETVKDTSAPKKPVRGRAITGEEIDYYDSIPETPPDTDAPEPSESKTAEPSESKTAEPSESKTAEPSESKTTDAPPTDSSNIEFIHGENSFRGKQGVEYLEGIENARELKSETIKDAAEKTREEAFASAWNDHDDNAIAMAQAKEGNANANAVSMVGHDAIATATNGSEANAMAGTQGGQGQAIASAQGYGVEGAKASAYNLGEGGSVGSAIAQGEGGDARSDALAQTSNSTAHSMAQKGGDARSNALTQKKGHADANAAALEGGEAMANALALGQGDTKAGALAEGGGNSTAQAKSYDGHATAGSKAKDRGSSYSASWSKGGGHSNAASMTIGAGQSRSESMNDGGGNAIASSYQHQEGKEDAKFNANQASDQLGAKSDRSEFGDPFFNRGKGKPKPKPVPITTTQGARK